MAGNRCKVFLLSFLAAALFMTAASCRKQPQSQTADNNEPTGQKVSTQQPTEAPAQELVPLEIVLPKLVPGGTKQDVRAENLEPLSLKDRESFYVPIGTTNIALGKPVTIVPDAEPVYGDPSMITDGDKEGTDGSYLELGPSRQDVTIDLQGSYEVYGILFWHYFKEPQVYHDVAVQIADDPDFITNVTTLFNNDTDNSAGLGTGTDMHYIETHKGKLVDAKGRKARYVRLCSQGNNNTDLNHYIEVEVFGKAVK